MIYIKLKLIFCNFCLQKLQKSTHSGGTVELGGGEYHFLLFISSGLPYIWIKFI